MARDLSRHIKNLERRGSWTCRGCGMKILGRPDIAKLCSDACRVRVEGVSRSRILSEAGVPPLYHAFDPTRLIVGEGGQCPRDPLSSLRIDQWYGDPWSLLITGGVGSGKSTLAAEMLYRVVSFGIETGRFSPLTAELALWFRPAQLDAERRQKPWGRRWELWDRALRSPVLAIDELGTYDLIPAILLELLEKRYSHQLPTICTTTCSLSRDGGRHSIEAWCRPIYDRFETGVCVRLDGESQRK